MVVVDDDTAGSTVADVVDIDDTAAAVDIVADPMIGKVDFVAPDSNSLIADYYLYIAVTEFSFGHPIAIVAHHLLYHVHLAKNHYLFH